MDGILISGGNLVGAVVSPGRPMDFFEQMGRLGMDMQKVRLGPGETTGIVWIDTGADMVRAVVVDALEG